MGGIKLHKDFDIILSQKVCQKKKPLKDFSLSGLFSINYDMYRLIIKLKY